MELTTINIMSEKNIFKNLSKVDENNLPFAIKYNEEYICFYNYNEAIDFKNKYMKNIPTNILITAQEKLSNQTLITISKSKNYSELNNKIVDTKKGNYCVIEKGKLKQFNSEQEAIAYNRSRNEIKRVYYLPVVLEDSLATVAFANNLVSINAHNRIAIYMNLNVPQRENGNIVVKSFNNVPFILDTGADISVIGTNHPTHKPPIELIQIDTVNVNGLGGNVTGFITELLIKASEDTAAYIDIQLNVLPYSEHLLGRDILKYYSLYMSNNIGYLVRCL